MNQPVPAADEKSLYQQLADELAAAVHGGTLPPGSRLPSVRQCAHSRRVSLNTVMAAYRLLEDRGLIEARPQSGYYVRAALPSVQRDPPPARRGAIRTDNTVRDLISAVLETQADDRYVDLSLACPKDSGFYPAAKLARAVSSELRRRPSLAGNYALPPGSLRLRQQIAQRGLALGMTLDPADITLTHGCMEALQLALRTVAKPGDTIGIESPTYFNLLPLLDSLGLKTLEIPTDPQNGLSLDVLELLLSEKRLAAVLAMPNVHNPLGCSMPLAAKQRLAALVNQYRVPLIEDALYAELQFAPALSPAVKAFDRDGWVIVCASFTKTLAPDFRIGWIDGGRFSQDIRQLKFVSSIAEPATLAEAVAAFLESGGYDHHLRGLRRRYAHQIETLRGQIAESFPAGTRATVPGGGFLIWVELPPPFDSSDLFYRALHERISIAPGSIFSPSGRYRNALRLSCCYPLDTRHLAAIARVGELAGESMPVG